jgi:N-acetylated-alpha-linked acidic dipeptidase
VTAFEPDLKPLGSGADFVPFQDYLGVPTMAIEFIGDNGYGYGTYHSNYDSRAYVERVADPGFTQGVLMSRVLGTMALRMSEAEVLPFRSHYASKLDDAITLAEDWAKDAATAIDVASLRAKATAVRDAAVALEAAIDQRLRTGARLADAPALNDRLARMEQLLADDDGAPESKWYRHVFYGWNIYSLYDGQPFPGLAEALRVRDAARATREVGRIERALDRMSTELTRGRALVR